MFSTFIIVGWTRTALEEVPLLVGKAARPEFINRISKIAVNHDEHIKNLDTVIVYHLGANFIVELHVVCLFLYFSFNKQNATEKFKVFVSTCDGIFFGFSCDLRL